MKQGILSLALLLAGCATAPNERPAWLLKPQELYPQAQYLVAIGEGDTRRAAENNASAGLARIFESAIQANESLSETATETKKSLSRISELKTQVQIGSSQNLLNIQFGETFTDHNGRVHIAALIPRPETSAIYRRRIAENSSDVQLLTDLSNQAPGPVGAYAFRRAAVRKALENDRMLAQLDIINPGAQNRFSLGYDPQTLYAETAAAAQKITFSVELSGDAGNALREALTGMGFSEGNPAVLTFSGNVDIQPTDLHRDTLVFVRCRYQIEARDRKQNLILSVSDSRREGHINFEQATLRAQRSLRTSITSEIPRRLGETLDRLASPEE